MDMLNILMADKFAARPHMISGIGGPSLTDCARCPE